MTKEDKRVLAGANPANLSTPLVYPQGLVKLFNRNDGSFLRPSPSSTAEHCIEFWSNVHIPDEIIDQAEKTYARVRDSEIAADLATATETWETKYREDNPEPRRDRELQVWTERFASEREAYQASILPALEGSRPRRLGNYDSRQIVRAAQMYYHQPDYVKFPEESEKLMNHQVELFDGVVTVADIERTYQMSSIHYCLEEIHKDDSLQKRMLATMEEVNGGIHGVRTALNYQINLQQDRDY